jgi:hypothetical protein
VLNAAIRVGGRLPVEARLERIDEEKLVFASGDSGAYGEFTDIAKRWTVPTPSIPSHCTRPRWWPPASSPPRPTGRWIKSCGGWAAGSSCPPRSRASPRIGPGHQQHPGRRVRNGHRDFFGIEMPLMDKSGACCARSS